METVKKCRMTPLTSSNSKTCSVAPPPRATKTREIAVSPLHITQIHAADMHLLVFNPERFTYKHQGLDGRLTGVEMVKPVKALMG